MCIRDRKRSMLPPQSSGGGRGSSGVRLPRLVPQQVGRSYDTNNHHSSNTPPASAGSVGGGYAHPMTGTVTHISESGGMTVSYTHLRAHETPEHLVCRLLLEKKKTNKSIQLTINRIVPK
eukprot:TRINITY_DN52951_c0_g1_i1.p1 TRINITY_DN52951_c0_g1~~TRINITY_DN52951_c0_g1_i1.p1  ORF type:complete len:120 (-),score=15.19 TRINITY_DN52951_c0_g1_i1:53-412(-)